MQISVMETRAEGLRAGYECPCGCRPVIDYAARGAVAHDACCCGNQFALGPRGGVHLVGRGPFRREAQSFTAPWGESLEAVWLIGPSTHAAEASGHHAEGRDDVHAHGHELPMAHSEAHHASGGSMEGMALDPVCGMTVDPESARANGLHSSYKGVDYFFCGKGCKLDFEEDPERYLDPKYVPSM